MGDARSLLKELTLRQILWPGSHDARMHVARDLTMYATAGNTVTQLHSIREQLDLGVRLFDVRPNIKNGEFVCGHVNNCGPMLGWQGWFGKRLQDVVQGINDFTAQHVGECVIVHIHDFCGFDADHEFRGFDQNEWRNVYDELAKLNNLLKLSDDEKEKPLSSFGWQKVVPEGKSTVIVVMSAGETYMSSNHGQGFYKSGQWYRKACELITFRQTYRSFRLTRSMMVSWLQYASGGWCFRRS